MSEKRGTLTVTRQLPLARDLDQVAARVVEYGCRHRARLDRLLGEADTETAKSLELVLNVLEANEVKGMPSSTSACLNGFAAQSGRLLVPRLPRSFRRQRKPELPGEPRVKHGIRPDGPPTQPEKWAGVNAHRAKKSLSERQSSIRSSIPTARSTSGKSS
jgi:hypothetical protein